MSETKIKQGAPDTAPLVLPEPPTATALTDFELKIPAVPVSSNRVPYERVPLGPIGLQTGSIAGANFNPGDGLGRTLLDRSPRTRTPTPPACPFEAKQDGRSGTVAVEFLVDEIGSVVSPRVTDSSDPIFNESAVRAIARWRFEPGRKDGRVVRFRRAVPIVFTLNGD